MDHQNEDSPQRTSWPLTVVTAENPDGVVIGTAFIDENGRADFEITDPRHRELIAREQEMAARERMAVAEKVAADDGPARRLNGSAARSK